MPGWHDDPLTDAEVRTLGRVTRRIAVILTVAFVLLLAAMCVAAGSAGVLSERPVNETEHGTAPVLALGLSVGNVGSKIRQGRSESTYQGKGVRWWARRAVQARKDANARGQTIRRLQASLRHRWQDTSLEAIAYASTAYGVSYQTLRRKAYCETGGTFDPYAKNRSSSASGLFQFLTSTWASTPYARFSIFDPYANALGAAWMHDVGRGGEWACR